MAFWCRIKHSQLKSLTNQFNRCYNFQIHGPFSVNYNASLTRILVVDNPSWVFQRSQFEFGHNVRFFAAPVQVKPKKEEKDTDGPRLNEQISAQFVRIVTEEGHGIVPRHEALQRARTLKLDLVEVQRNAKPPVCKLMNFRKEKYLQEIKDKERSKAKVELTMRKGPAKEVRIATKIEQKDLQVKADAVKRLMEHGYRVKCMAMGNEDQDLGGLLSRLTVLIEEFSIVESGPRVEKKQAYVVVRHIKYGPPKKGSGNRKIVIPPPTTNPSTQSPSQLEESSVVEESGLESEEDILSEDEPALEKNKSTWSVLDKSYNLDKVFEFRNDVSQIANSSSHGQMKTAPVMSSSPANASPKAPFGTENRYKTGSTNRVPPQRQTNVTRPDARNSTGFEPRFQKPGRQRQFDLNSPSPSTEPKRTETEPPMFRNLKPFVSEFPTQDISHPSAPSSPAPSYGMFNAPKVDNGPERQSGPAEVNRYKKGPNPSPPSSNSRGRGRPDDDKSGQGRRGIFQPESLNMTPSGVPETKPKMQR